ncbi:hypothetical protein NA57DRAFT_53769 [Rhizodiscina lignyota]|uniref:Glycoside hydrolase subgroup catalytic core n=1 Tax=Rhizodiscina lignyota TaxID=1504668 RepID=A0A9P4IHU0_9PEZI|nr:hypothetical protein NA57DRAFT_53769 [Rhizodiscina lignyota]
MRAYGLFYGALFGSLAIETAGQFNNPPSVLIWCGKAYNANNASFNPGGWLSPPEKSDVPLLDLRVYPRFQVYTASEDSATLVVDVEVSYRTGMPLCDYGGNNSVFYDTRSPGPPQLHLTVSDAADSSVLISNAAVPLGSIGEELSISLGDLPAQSLPRDLEVTASLDGCTKTFKISTQILRVPDRTDGGTVTKLDRKNGGLLVQDYKTAGSPLQPLLPYSYYVDWGGWLMNSTSQMNVFKSYGFNIIHIVPPGGPEPFNWTQFDAFMDRADELQLWVMYDMRNTYLNLSSLEEQVNHLKSRKSLLTWYTADEPDGNSDPLNGTTLAYQKLRELDPYRPVSLVLNCYNFHFPEYTAGADIIMEDVYPIATNLTFSDQWNTTCNTTYGDCGCDDCFAPPGSIEDVRKRYEAFDDYESWLGWKEGPPKPIWGVPQAFGGSEYWKRPPTATEEAAMAMLRINNGAKGIVAWNWPTTMELANVTGMLARSLTQPAVTETLLGSQPIKLETNLADSKIDARLWRAKGKMLLSIVAVTTAGSDGEVVVQLPKKIDKVDSVVWGAGDSWNVHGKELRKSVLSGYEVDVFFVS